MRFGAFNFLLFFRSTTFTDLGHLVHLNLCLKFVVPKPSVEFSIDFGVRFLV